jgi:hypothetical protein
MSGPEAMAFVAFVTVVGGVLYTWITLHYRNRGGTKSPDLARIEERLSHIEQAIDAMAVETERISEGQRFTTKLLGERAAVKEER